MEKISIFIWTINELISNLLSLFLVSHRHMTPRSLEEMNSLLALVHFFAKFKMLDHIQPPLWLIIRS